MSRQSFTGPGLAGFPPASHTAVNTTVTRTNLWVPALWTPIPAFEPKAGTTYILRCGGVLGTTTGTNTIIFNPTFGQSATPATNVALGVSTTVTLTASLTAVPWSAEFVLGFRQLGIAAAGATATGNGWVTIGGAAATAGIIIPIGGSVPTTLDHTVASGLCLDATWGTSNAANTITCQWTHLQTLD